MRYSDSETQQLLRNTTRSYLAAQFPPERLYAIESGDAPLMEDELQKLTGMGWLGLIAPDTAGGGGLGLVDAAVVIEEFGYAAVPAPVIVSNVAADLISRAKLGDAPRHLDNLTGGKQTYTVSESTRASDAEAASYSSPTAVAGRLHGTLPRVPFASLANWVLAPLTLDGQPAFAAFALEGARLEQTRLLDRATYADVHLEDVQLGHTTILATGDDALALHDRCDALVTALSLIEAVGLMQRTLEMTSQYITERVQFGQPIAKFQAARHRAADLLMQTETTRWAAYHALWRFEQDPADTSEIWLAKHWAVRAADRVFHVSHLLHGGVGVDADYPLHLYTQAIAAFAVRGGGMSEMVERTLEGLELTPRR